MQRTIALIAFATLVTGGMAVGCGGGGENPSNVGNSCSSDDDCDTDNCYQGPAGGYCTANCSSEGETEPCPVDTVCKPIQGKEPRCLLICGSDSACDDNDCNDDECPDGSSCVDVSDSDARACEPDP